MGRREEGQYLLATLLANCNLPFPQTRREGRGKKEQKTVQHVRTWDLGFVVWIGSQLEPKA